MIAFISTFLLASSIHIDYTVYINYIAKGIFMTSKKHMALLACSGILLAGCGRVTLKKVESANEELHENQTHLVQTLNKNQKLEGQMSQDFSDSIQDKDLKQLKDGSGPVFKNIEKRQKNMDQVNDQLKQLKKQAKVIEGYDKDESLKAAKKELTDALTTIEKQLASYQKDYQQSLKDQENSLKKLAKKDTKPEQFIKSIKKINEQHEKLQKKLKKVDQQLQKLEEKQNTFDKDLKEAIKKDDK